jgi:hypothetical protein
MPIKRKVQITVKLYDQSNSGLTCRQSERVNQTQYFEDNQYKQNKLITRPQAGQS